MAEYRIPKDYYRKFKRRESALYSRWMAGKLTRVELDDKVRALYDEMHKVAGASEIGRVGTVRLVIR